jgi:hypothetical protein
MIFEQLGIAYIAQRVALTSRTPLTGAAAKADEVAEFDPVEFGRRCAAIAREKIGRFWHNRSPASRH